MPISRADQVLTRQGSDGIGALVTKLLFLPLTESIGEIRYNPLHPLHMQPPHSPSCFCQVTQHAAQNVILLDCYGHRSNASQATAGNRMGI